MACFRLASFFTPMKTIGLSYIKLRLSSDAAGAGVKR